MIHQTGPQKKRNLSIKFNVSGIGQMGNNVGPKSSEPKKFPVRESYMSGLEIFFFFFCRSLENLPVSFYFAFFT